ncbi:MAG: hypothetical protein JNL50_00870 [Phycisphaerae bacterium]|nr:hypothetical protein [Phycisphaerae bacterium]
MKHRIPTAGRREDILHAALREQALARRGRRILAATTSAALVLIVEGLVTWRFLPSHGPSDEDRQRDLMASQPRIPTPEESNRQDPRYRLAPEPSPRLIVERVSTTPGLAKKLAFTPAASTVPRATDDDLARALHAANPNAGLVRVDGQLFAASGNTLVRPENLTAPDDAKPQSMLAPHPNAVGV